MGGLFGGGEGVLTDGVYGQRDGLGGGRGGLNVVGIFVGLWCLKLLQLGDFEA